MQKKHCTFCDYNSLGTHYRKLKDRLVLVYLFETLKNCFAGICFLKIKKQLDQYIISSPEPKAHR